MLSTQANHALPLFPLLNLLSFCCKENNLNTSFHCLPFSPCTSLISPEYIFHQSAALPPLAAPAQTWKPTTAKMIMLLASTAAAASVEIQVGSALLVSSTQQLEPNIGSQKYHFALQMAVAMKVSGAKKMVLYSFSLNTPCHRYGHLTKPPWQLPKQSEEDRDDTSGAGTDHLITIHCI